MSSLSGFGLSLQQESVLFLESPLVSAPHPHNHASRHGLSLGLTCEAWGLSMFSPSTQPSLVWSGQIEGDQGSAPSRSRSLGMFKPS